MKVLIDIPTIELKALSQVCEKEKVSRAEILRRAVRSFLAQIRSGKKLENYFGIWKKKKIDGLKYEDKIRSEW